MGFDEFQVAKNVAARSVGDNLPGVEQYDARTEFQHHLKVMRGDQLGAWQAVDQLNQAAATARIEICRRLVKSQYRRLTCQHARQAGAFRSPKLR